MYSHGQETQQQENRTTADRRGNKSPKSTPITAAENQPITAEYRSL